MSAVRIISALISCLLVSTSLVAQSNTIEKIQVQGNQYVDEGTYLFHINTKVGDPYDRDAAIADFGRLWETGFLDDLTLDVSDGETGKILTFIVVERARVRIVEYRGSKELKPDDIETKLEEEEAQIAVESFYDPARIVKAEKIIRQMLVDKGRTDGNVSSQVVPSDSGGVNIVFDIRDEQKVRIKSVTFEGSDQIDDWELRWGMKKTRESHLFSFISGGATYTDETYAEDVEKVRELYLNKGYVNVTFGEPTMEYEDGYSRFLFWKRPRRWLNLTIPVNEGKQYRVGSVDVEGAEVLPKDFVRGFFKLQEGEVYNESKINKGLETLREIYGSRGYIQFTGFPIKRPIPDQDLVDVTITLNEDKQYFINRIEFEGNTTTRDKVIRRDFWLNEQDVMNMEMLKASIRRINQLGYFRPIEQPEIMPVEGEENKLDIVLKLTEQNRNQFTFGGGVSGLEGTFINLGFSTSNFLGRGETASFNIQTGSRTQNFQIALTEPWFLDKPITAGFDVFKRTLKLPQFTRKDTGASLVFGVPVKRFSRFFFRYNYSVINTSDPDPDLILTPYDYYGLNNPFLDPRFQISNFRSSKVTPSFVHNTTDNPLFATRGVRYTTSLDIAGGILGGTVNYLKPTFEGVWYKPVSRTTSLGFRAMVSWLRGYGDTATTVDVGQSTGDGYTWVPTRPPVIGIDVTSTGIPFFERFFMGGENQIRGYDIRSVGPRDENGLLVGGTKMMLFNVEYSIPLAGPLRAVLFFDAGQAYPQEMGWSKEMFELAGPDNPGGLHTSTGGEMRFFVPVLNVPFRLIFAFNPHRAFYQPSTSFRFGIGTTF
jgi:outer membrane protein insertion porin family